MATFDDVVRVAAHLPEVEESTWYGTPGLKVRGKGFCRVWGQREYERNGVGDTEVLVVFCDPDEKEYLLAAEPSVLFSTPHYEGHGAMLVRLAEVSDDALTDFLEDSYRIKAPKSLVARLDG